MDDVEAEGDARPLNTFPRVVLQTLEALSLNGELDSVRVLGSGARRTVLYPSDVDAYAIFEAPAASKSKAAEWAATRFQKCIYQLLELPSTFLGDVKAGVLLDCRVLPWKAYLKAGKRLVGYNQAQAEARVREMHAHKLLDDAEAAESLKMLQEAGPAPTPEQWLKLQDALRFEVVRWSLADIKAGRKEVRGGRTLTLAEAWQQPNIVKVDAVVYNSATARYMDVSVIYELQSKSGAVVNDAKRTSLPLQQSIGTDVVKYALKHKYMKVCKRMLSLATLHKDDRAEQELLDITNSPAGLLYAVAADAGTCAFLVENEDHYDKEKMGNELDAMKSRIATAQALLEKFPDLEAECDKHVKAALKARTPHEMLPQVEAIADTLATPVSKSALQQLIAAHLYPPPRWALP